MKRVGKTLKRFWPLYLMFLPGAVYLFINCYIPMFGIQIAFRTYNAKDGIYGSPWCGLENFEFLFRTDDAWIMTRNTLLYNFVFIVLGTVLAIAVAIILNEAVPDGYPHPLPDLHGYRQLFGFRFPEHQQRLHQPWYLGAPVWRECRHRLV